MVRRLLVLVLTLGILLPPAGGVAAKGGDRKSTGIAVESASYDANTGKLATKLRWNKRELRRDGRDEQHIVVYNDGATPLVLRHREVSATVDRHRRTHRIKLSPRQRRIAGDGSDLTIVATHLHDDDGGHFDRAWHHRLRLASARDASNVKCLYFQYGGDLSGCNLKGVYLANMDLSGSDFSGAGLSHADLGGSDLTAADFSGATLSFAMLNGAITRGVDLTGATAIGAFVENADLTGATMTRANMTGAHLAAAILNDANLQGATLDSADLSTASLREARLDGASLTQAYARNANLRGANLSQAVLRNANLFGAYLVIANMTGADLSGANLRGAVLSGTILDGAIYCATTMSDGTIINPACQP
jgi:uncharacterized protein YjbI with pentapeptide repeats